MKNYLIFLSIPVVLLLYHLVTYIFIDTFEERGRFGDSFGAVNALFSGFAFLGIIYTIYLQRNELSLQREELKLTRQELNRSAEAQEKSERALIKQADSLKMTSKLYGLSSLMQYEIAMRNKDISLGRNNDIFSIYNDDELKSIINEIKNSINS